MCGDVCVESGDGGVCIVCGDACVALGDGDVYCVCDACVALGDGCVYRLPVYIVWGCVCQCDSHSNRQSAYGTYMHTR